MWAVVVAGGSGRRFGGPKQFLSLAGRPLARWSVDAAKAACDGVVLVVPSDGATSPELSSQALPSPGATGEAAWGADVVVSGGATRAASVRAGLAAISDRAAIVVVHDGARPLASPALFEAVIAPVRNEEADGAVPVVTVADTLKRVVDGRVASTVDRDGVVAVQTPQAFAADLLRSVHHGEPEATDDAGLVESTGAVVRAVEGDPRNIKVTHRHDFLVADALMTGMVR